MKFIFVGFKNNAFQDDPALGDLPAKRAEHLLSSQCGCIDHVQEMEGGRQQRIRRDRQETGRIIKN